jgi:hypothetical protein
MNDYRISIDVPIYKGVPSLSCYPEMDSVAVDQVGAAVNSWEK